MANFNVLKASILIVLLILSAHVRGLDALNYQGRKNLRKSINSGSLLRELGFDLSKINLNKKRALITDNGTSTEADRVTPGGPGHIHHTSPPSVLP
ncbi:hypothetical protein I3843_09G067300 [Carya illinoinensis]|uniref:Uncharacterized protein n=1 Tax=Carya illinoinensis TaxID=32201 RepID=A0A922E2T9_CARIL|nr:hypothetical protein I3760_09G066900 [Carya illinoinensis]KAG6694811.1 hypothetical protein I3842_09G067200 [Carya illinoinensis]KAG7962445.1 hypothetical protein I3843_09G067300 [Carya illinoinensis]